MDEQTDHSEKPPLTREDLIAFIRGGETPPQDWVVGTEHEKVGVYREGFAPVPYEGPRGIGEFLKRMAELDDWQPVYEGENVIALLKEGASITLEPGGQLELSGAPLRTIHQTCEEFHNHLRLVKEISHSFGIIWLGLGIRPLHGVDDVPRMPKVRYGIMRAYLPTRAKLGVEMMHLTATVQANFDFSDEADMRRKMRLAMGASPILSAVYANSSIAEKKPTGYASRRLRIWRDTDPDRCGLLPFVFHPDFGYGDYVDWALDVPMFFIVRGGQYIALEGKSFRQFMLDGHGEHSANIGDFELHLTTLFPEVRLKRVIEVRGCDAVPSPLTCALPAFWKGLLYDREACDTAWEVVKDWEFEERVEFLVAAAKEGLSARTTRGTAKDLAAELVAISTAGLRRIAHAGHGEPDETLFLGPLQEQIASGKSPGELLLEKWEGEWNYSLPRLMDYARYC